MPTSVAAALLGRTLSLLKGKYEDGGIPIPSLTQIILRPEWTVLFGDDMRSAGMVINFTGRHAIHGAEPLESHATACKGFLGRPLDTIVESCLQRASLFDRSIAVGALGALSQSFLSEAALRSGGYGLVPGLPALIRRDDVVAVVGYGAFVDTLRGRCRELHVTEMRPADHFYSLSFALGAPPGRIPGDVSVHAAESNEEVLGKADVVLITASTLVNDTLGEVLGYASSARTIGLYGPSGSIVPDAFMDAGIGAMRVFEICDYERFRTNANQPGALEQPLKSHQKSHCIVRGTHD